MFSKTDGPTALRADLVRSLSFSLQKIERISDGTKVTSVAALAGVWNGRKGHVAILVRDVEPAAISRYVGDGPITSEGALDAAIEEGLAFAESLGFSMDAPDFLALTGEERDARILRWNKLRKLRQPDPVAAPEAPQAIETPAPLETQAPPETPAPLETPAPYVPELDIPEPPPIPSGYDIGLDDLSLPPQTPAPDLAFDFARPQSERNAAPDLDSQDPNARSTVLGRISLVRRDGADLRRLELLARLLAFY